MLNIGHFKITTISLSVFPILVFLRPARAQPPQWTPDELMRQVVSNELRAEELDHSHWMFRLETKKNAQTEVDEVIETNDGDLKRPILFNGHERAQTSSRRTLRRRRTRSNRFFRDSQSPQTDRFCHTRPRTQSSCWSADRTPRLLHSGRSSTGPCTRGAIEE